MKADPSIRIWPKGYISTLHSQIVLKGVVLDEYGNPTPYVNIYLDEKRSIRTISDERGNYRLVIPEKTNSIVMMRFNNRVVTNKITKVGSQHTLTPIQPIALHSTSSTKPIIKKTALLKNKKAPSTITRKTNNITNITNEVIPPSPYPLVFVNRPLILKLPPNQLSTYSYTHTYIPTAMVAPATPLETSTPTLPREGGFSISISEKSPQTNETLIIKGLDLGAKKRSTPIFTFKNFSRSIKRVVNFFRWDSRRPVVSVIKTSVLVSGGMVAVATGYFIKCYFNINIFQNYSFSENFKIFKWLSTLAHK